MELSEILYQKTNDILTPLARLCGDCQGATRKDDLVGCIHRTLMQPESLRQLWAQMDDLSKKVVAAAYHNDGEFNPTAFIAQYGRLPERPQSRWYWQQPPILVDLFIYNGLLPSDLRPLLAELVPLPERFQVEGLANTPKAVDDPDLDPIDLICAETEPAGRHDLLAYLRLVSQGQIKISSVSSRATMASIRKIAKSLLEEDFLPLPEKYRASDTIRPFGLDVFGQESGLAAKARGRNELQLTKAGRDYYQTQDPRILLAAFESWTQKGDFDELSRVSALKGQNARRTYLTHPATRREAVIEALSWCPVNVWIDIQDFYRALKIWHFDFEVEATPYTNLYVGYQDNGTLYGDNYWPVVKGLYTNVVLWEYLGSLGALDLLYLYPEEAELAVASYYYDDDGSYYSLFDGLKYLRINTLGAYLLGQAADYVPAIPLDRAIFAVTGDLRVTITQPDAFTPNDRNLLELMAAPLKNGQYRLDLKRLLTALEEGNDLDHLADFLENKHSGPLPEEVPAWFKKARYNSQVFKTGGQALFIKAKSADLAEMVLTDSVLKKFCKAVDQKTLVIPANREKAFRARLKELEYTLL